MPVTLNNTNITINDGTNNFVLETVKTHVPEVDIDIDIVPAITYPDTTTRNLQLAAETATGVNGWIHVKHLPASSSTWFYKDDDLQGVNYGTAYDTTSQWSITYPSDMDEILLVKDGSTFEKWLRIDKSVPTTYQGGWYGGYAGTHMTAIDSSLSDKRYAYFNDGRSGAPWFWIGPVSHTSYSSILYQEDSENVSSWPSASANPENVSYEVFVRKSTDTISSSIIPAMPVYETQTTVTQYPVLPADSTNLVAHYKFDGDLIDSSGNGNHITSSTGTIDYHTNIKKIGQSSLIGANEYIEITSLNVLTGVWSGAFTISFWLYPTTSDKEYLVGGWDNASSGGLRGGWYITARNGNLEWEGLTGGNFLTIIGTDNNIVANAWNHISISNNGTTFNIILNGIVKTLTTSNTLDTPHTNLGDRHIGIGRAKRWGGSGYDYDNNGGYYDDFRIYDKVLSAYEIDILANNKIENPDYNILTFEYQGPSYPVIDADAASLVAHYKFDDTNDSNPTSTKYNLTNNAVTFVDGKINKCALFDHSSDLLSASTINLSNLLGTEFTFSLWVKVKSGISAHGQVFQYFQDNNNNIYFRRANANRFTFWIWQNGYLGFDGALDMPNYIVDEWNHYVITYTGTEAKAYFNGILHQTNVLDGTEFNIGNSTLRIGDRNGLDQHFYGEIDDFRIYNKALSATEISDLYSQYNQTSYTVNFPAESECDILIVGGGGGGGRFGGGGGGGSILFRNNIELNGTYTIKTGNGGTGAPDFSGNGTNGYDSSITIDGIEYIAKGGGGGGTRTNSSGNPGRSGNDGGSGGGGSQSDTGQTYGGTSIKNTYTDWESYGNEGGDGRNTTSPWTSGGGGGAGSSGSNASNTSGGNGGTGKDLISYFGTNVGHNGYFGGGGGGNIYVNTGTPGYGNGGNGLYGGGGNGAYEGSPDISAIDGLPNTGGGGGGGKFNDGTVEDLNGGHGGSGIVIIRYKTKYIIQHPAYDAQWTYHSANPNVHHYGNVGIGTLASETNKLTVKGDINVIGDIYENNNKIAYGWDVYGNSVYNQYGNVGIGTNDPRYALHTTGIIYAGQGGITETGSTTWTITSDNRIKENIEKASYDICSENIKNINLYRFNYNTKYVKTTDKNQLGFIAQDVRKYFPKAVKNKTTRFDNDVVPNLLSVDVTQLNYTMYGAVKHIGQDIDAIKEKLGITEVPTEIKNEPYAIEVVPFNDPDAELPIVNEEPATN